MGGIAIDRFVDGKIVDDWGIQVTCPTAFSWVDCKSTQRLARLDCPSCNTAGNARMSRRLGLLHAPGGLCN